MYRFCKLTDCSGHSFLKITLCLLSAEVFFLFVFCFFFEVTYSDERKQLAGRLLSRIDIFTMKKIIEFMGVDPSPNLPQKSRIKILTAGNTYFQTPVFKLTIIYLLILFWFYISKISSIVFYIKITLPFKSLEDILKLENLKKKIN